MHRETLDVLSLLEAAYLVEPSNDDWLRNVLKVGRPVFDRGLGLNGYFVDAAAPDTFSAWGLQSEGRDETVERESFRRWSDSAPVLLKRHAHLHRPAMFASQLPPGNLAREAFQQSFEITGYADVLGVSALDATGVGCAFAIPCCERQERPPKAADTVLWERVAAHVAAALRLRRRLDQSADESPDAVVDPGGRVEHAQGEAKRDAALGSLRAAAQRFDRARTKGAGHDPLEATRMWQALVAGRWSLVDQFDSDGRRYIVARRNPPVVDAWERLTPREAQVLRAAALGHSNKMVAYELGVAPSTVSTSLRRAAAKLGATSRVELIRACAARWGCAPPEPPAPPES